MQLSKDEFDYLRETLEDATSNSVKQFSIHILVLFVLLAVTWNTFSNWDDSYLSSERSAKMVLDSLYPLDAKEVQNSPSGSLSPVKSSESSKSVRDSLLIVPPNHTFRELADEYERQAQIWVTSPANTQIQTAQGRLKYWRRGRDLLQSH